MPRTPSDPLENIQREVERLFHDLVYRRHPSAHFAEQPWVPPADLVVTERSARVIIELAGVPRENVRVRLRGEDREGADHVVIYSITSPAAGAQTAPASSRDKAANR